MLIRKVHAKRHKWRTLFPCKRSLQPVGPSSSTLLGWFRLPPIDQYSSLLPPVGVWAVSQSQCGGGLPLRTPIHRSLGGPLPRQQANGTRPHPAPERILSPQAQEGKGGHRGLIPLSGGWTRVPGRLGTRYSPVRRSPSGASLRPCCPATCMC